MELLGLLLQLGLLCLGGGLERVRELSGLGHGRMLGRCA